MNRETTDNPARAFVSEISKEIYDADDEDEMQRRSISHYPLINTRLRLCNFCVAANRHELKHGNAEARMSKSEEMAR